jgi:hypothetical protein
VRTHAPPPDIALIPGHLATEPDVAYFAKRDAGYASGDVMLCPAPLTAANTEVFGEADRP